MVSASHHHIHQQSRSPLISFLHIPTNFAIDFLFLMGNYSLLRVIICDIDRACVPMLPPAQGGKGVRTALAPTLFDSTGLLTSASFNTKSQLILWTITWALHFSSDIFIFILPFPVLRTLRLNWKKKLGLYTTFGFGILSITACLARFLTVVLTYPNVPTTNIELWCALDSYVGLLVVCLPPLRPLLNLKQVSSQRSTPNDGYRGRVFDRSIGPAGSDYQLTMPPEVYSQKGPLGRPERRLPPNC